MQQSSSQSETAAVHPDEAQQSGRGNRFLGVVGYLIMVFGITGFTLDLFEMGRVFWGVFILWLLVVRLLIVIKRPEIQSNQSMSRGSSVEGA